jgi:WD40 repeat protein
LILGEIEASIVRITNAGYLGIFVTQLGYSSCCNVYFALFSTGSIALLRRFICTTQSDPALGDDESQIEGQQFEWVAHYVGDNSYVNFSYNEQLSLLAIGLIDGTYELYSIHKDYIDDHFYSLASVVSSTQSIPQFVTFVCHVSHGLASVDAKDISCMKWSSDGFALAVGYKNEGLVLFSAFGTIVFHATRKTLQTTLIQYVICDF